MLGEYTEAVRLVYGDIRPTIESIFDVLQYNYGTRIANEWLYEVADNLA